MGLLQMVRLPRPSFENTLGGESSDQAASFSLGIFGGKAGTSFYRVKIANQKCYKNHYRFSCQHDLLVYNTKSVY